MTRYLVERLYDAGADMPQIGRRSREIRNEQFPEIIWEHSHVVMDAEGNVKSFCVYDAPDETIVLEHAKRLGQHSVINVYEIGGDVTPEDFPL